MSVRVNPDTLLFTQDSIKNVFRCGGRIDNAVDSILRGDLSASSFPALKVVIFEGRYWSLDNRRLWVFKKAGVKNVNVDMRHHTSNDRIKKLMSNLALKEAILQPDYLPKVRGFCREVFLDPRRRILALIRISRRPGSLVTTHQTVPEPLCSKGPDEVERRMKALSVDLRSLTMH